MESFLNLKTCLRPRVLTTLRSVMSMSWRHVRGRPTSVPTHSYQSKSESSEFDSGGDDWSASGQTREASTSGGDQYWDVFSRAKQGFGDRSDEYDMSREFDERPERHAKNRFNDRFDKSARND